MLATRKPAPQSTNVNGRKKAPKIAFSVAKAVIKAPVKFAIAYPKLTTRYALPLALTTLSTPLIAALPLGSVAGSVLGYVAVTTGRFKLRKELMGSYYALMHLAGMTGIQGQMLSLLGLAGLEATGSHKLRDTFVQSLIESNIGVRAQVVGLALAVLSGATGTLGGLGSLLGVRARNLLFKELRSFVTFYGFKWAATNLHGLWVAFVASSEEVKAAFLAYMLGKKDDRQKGNIDDPERMRWARGIQETVAARLPQLPFEALMPQVAAVMKDKKKEQKMKGAQETINDWVEIAYEDVEDMDSGKADLAAYADEAALEGLSHHRSTSENIAALEQVARKALKGSGMSEKEIIAALDEMGMGESTAAWAEEAEDDDDDDQDWVKIEEEL